MHNKSTINGNWWFSTKYQLATECGFDWENIQFLGILGLSRYHGSIFWWIEDIRQVTWNLDQPVFREIARTYAPELSVRVTP